MKAQKTKTNLRDMGNPRSAEIVPQGLGFISAYPSTPPASRGCVLGYHDTPFGLNSLEVRAIFAPQSRGPSPGDSGSFPPNPSTPPASRGCVLGYHGTPSGLMRLEARAIIATQSEFSCIEFIRPADN